MKIALIFDVTEDVAKRLIPSIGIEAEITAGQPGAMVFVTNNPKSEVDNYYQGFNAELKVIED